MDIATGAIITTIITSITAILIAIINKNKVKTRARTKAELQSPKNHYFFGKLKYYQTSIIPCLKPIDGVPLIKIKMLQKFLQIKFNIFYTGMMNWINLQDDVKLSDVILYIMTLINEYEVKAKERGIPEMFLTSFAIQHKPVVDATIQCIEQITRCESYDNVDKENAILDTLLHAFVLTIVNVEATAKNMNGELEQLLISISNNGDNK